MRDLIIIDTANLFHSIRMKYNGELIYNKFFGWIESIHGKNPKRIYVQDNPRATKFIDSFRLFQETEIITKKPVFKKINRELIETVDFDTQIITDVLTYVPGFAKLILCSSSIELLPLLQVVPDIYIYACGIPKIFSEYSNVKEIQHEFINQRISRSA
jgi:hypothetical protein